MRPARPGINRAIIPGIMPITSFKQIKTITEMCEASIPGRSLSAALRRARRRPGSGCRARVAYATLQCCRSPGARAPGIHFYTLNRSPATRAILARCAPPSWERALASV